MILPERVLGRPGENWIWSGAANGPISFLTCSTSYLLEVVARLVSEISVT